MSSAVVPFRRERLYLPDVREASVLVINSSHDMAKEITMQLSLSMPGCSIIYAPSIEVGRWVLKRRKINLIIANRMLPDGSVSGLEPALAELENPPDVVIVGDNLKKAEVFSPQFQMTRVEKIVDPIKNLGADLRNDLNNPLQEIVAMVFVAKTGANASPAVERALEAIDHAARNMASVVWGLEEKIKGVVRV